MGSGEKEVKDTSLYEVSWEVCNKVGGIYTVISSKAEYISSKYGNYTLIGPYLPHHPPRDFVEELPSEELKEVFNELKNQGILCRYGRWLIKTQPYAILVDFSGVFQMKNEIKSKLWEKYKIDSLNTSFDFDEPVMFSVAVAQLLDLIQKKSKKKMIAQFHEWMTGVGILWLKQQNSKIATVFTTHATVLGRAIAGVNSNFYKVLNSIDPEKEAREHGVVGKHQVEKASALNSSIFTTVSEITAMEAEKILERKVDIVLPNGIDLKDFSSFEEISIKHSQLKHEIKNFISSYFFPYYSFELDNTIIFFMMGRYEYENKGIDVSIEALGKLNEYMKKEAIDKTIVTFFYVPGATSNINHEVLENKTDFLDIKNFVDKEKDNIASRIIYLTASEAKLKKQSILDDSIIEVLTKKANSFVRKGSPPLSTHDLKYYDQDPIISAFKKFGLLNKKEDKVKVIFYPTYVQSTDNLLDLDLYDAITGGHLGIFASAYEPWGYTPLESAALGVASITSDLSGFGRYIEKESSKKNPGIFVLKRAGLEKNEITKNLFEIFKYYVNLDKEKRIENKLEARRLATLADWKNLVNNYFEAYNLALKKV